MAKVDVEPTNAIVPYGILGTVGEQGEIIEDGPIYHVGTCRNETERRQMTFRIIARARKTKEFWVADFLSIHSKNTAKSYSGYLTRFFRETGDDTRHPLDYDLMTIKKALVAILASDKSKSYKAGYLTAVKTFYEGLVYEYNLTLEQYGIAREFWAPFPIPPRNRLPRMRESSKKLARDKTLTLPEMSQILKLTKANADREMQVALGLLMRWGSRASEVRSLKIEHCFFYEDFSGYGETGLVEGCMKSNPSADPNKKLVFPFNSKIGYALYQWIQAVLAKNPDEIWVFPSDSEEGFLSLSAINKFLEDIRAKMDRKDVKIQGTISEVDRSLVLALRVSESICPGSMVDALEPMIICITYPITFL